MTVNTTLICVMCHQQSKNKQKQYTMNPIVNVFPEISKILLRVEDFNHAIDEVIEVIGKVTDVDRSYLFTILPHTNNDKLLKYQSEWCKENITPEIDAEYLQNVKLSELGDFGAAFQVVPSMRAHVKDCPFPEAKALLEVQDVKSYLWVRLMYNDDFLGFVGFDSCEKERDWTEEETEALEYLADMIALRYVRHKAENKAEKYLKSLSQQNKFLQKVRDIQSDLLVNPNSKKAFKKFVSILCKHCHASFGFLTLLKEGNTDNNDNDIQFETLANLNKKWEQAIGNLINVLVENDQGTLKWDSDLKGNALVINSNDPVVDKKYYVKGGIKLKNFLGIPIYYANRLIGVLGLANFDSDVSSKTIHQIEYAVDTCANILHSYSLQLDRIKAIKRMNDQRLAFESVFETTLSGYWDWNLNTNEEFLSPMLKKGIGYNDNEMTNQVSEWMALANEEDVKLLFSSLVKHINSRGEEPFKHEVSFKHKDGSTVHMLVGGCVTEWSDEGEPLRIIGCHVDISENIIAGEILEENLHKEQALVKMKSHLISMVSHQFRTPMSIIQSNVELVEMKLDEKLQAITKSNFFRIKKELNWMNEMLEQVFMLEKSKSDSAVLKRETTNIIDLLNDVLEDYKISNKQIVFERINWPTEAVFVHGDDIDLRHIFNNILANAIKYGGEKNPLITFTANQNEVEIKIKDFGIGIPEEDKDIVFSPFQRGTNTDGIPGTGLGLSIVYELVKGVGGQITFASETGKWTEFAVSLKKQEKVMN